VPHKIFQFIPASASLKKLFKSDEFNSLLKKGRRAQAPGIISDITQENLPAITEETDYRVTSKDGETACINGVIV
jgi:hypothetical protein